MKIDAKFTKSFIPEADLKKSYDNAITALKTLKKRDGLGNEFLGWLDLPESFTPKLANEIEQVVNSLKHLDSIVIIGIGGSYLGAKAVIEALSEPFRESKIIYAGHNLSETYHKALIKHLENKNFGIIVISKSGTTTEPAIAFRLLKNLLIEKLGEDKAYKQIVAITDASKGALRKMADVHKIKSFIIDDDIGGRYSVFSPVGLVPIALAGISISELMEGASTAAKQTMEESNENPAVQYAALRNVLLNSGKNIELMVSYQPELQYIIEWWKQLFGESEGKNHKGIFPASVQFTTDLHSLGQYVQDGQRILFETVLRIENTNSKLYIPKDSDDYDDLNYLAGKTFHYVNSTAEKATSQAHYDGGVPVIRIEIPEITAYNIGYMLYTFEVACAISAYMLGVNPFDQPGV
ncbi:MAG: glucose-6-phosphate isomerase, partial [Bacteroidales bacterium]|nr:glucose-6-phosphate isomerase [Bacteroidales bacterium]